MGWRLGFSQGLQCGGEGGQVSHDLSITKPYYDSEGATVYRGDCLAILPTLEANSVDTVITDPPYALTANKRGGSGVASLNENSPAGRSRITTGGGFMGKKWDAAIPGPEVWREVLRVAKPGAMLLAFGGTRTFHRLVCAIEDAGWEIRDCMMFLYGCLSDDTEILVDGQWELYRRALTGRHALCYDVEHDTYSWQPIQDRFVYDYDDTAYRIQSDHTDQLVSRNHRCLVERSGAYVFELAEEAAREREARVPILEDVQGLLNAIPLPHKGTGGAECNVRAGMRGRCDQGAAIQEASLGTPWAGSCGVCGLRHEGLPTPIPCVEGESTDLFEAVQRATSRTGMGQARIQGGGGGIARGSCVCDTEDDRPEQSRMEGRRDLLSQARQLQADQVCPVSARFRTDGEERRLRDGTSAGGCTSTGTAPVAVGSSTSRRSRPPEQSSRKPATICQQSSPQAVRASRYTRADLARITPVHYRGIVWCVRVPTGAFVVRRNGKVFVTGNSGFPKSHDISKAIDKAAGEEGEKIPAGEPVRRMIPGADQNSTGSWIKDNGREYQPGETIPATDAAHLWQGWGTALKPAWEIIVLAMKPLDGTFAQNAQKWGVAGLNVDGGRIGGKPPSVPQPQLNSPTGKVYGFKTGRGRNGTMSHAAGRFPANLILSHLPECEEVGEKTVPAFHCAPGCPVAMLDEQSGVSGVGYRKNPSTNSTTWFGRKDGVHIEGERGYVDTGGASRFFYCAKASRKERGEGNTHPTVKPVKLMEYLCKLTATPTGGVVLDPFMGSGTTGVACANTGREFIGIEIDKKWCEVSAKRIKAAQCNLSVKQMDSGQLSLLDQP